jgi:hypothetical protein
LLLPLPLPADDPWPLLSLLPLVADDELPDLVDVEEDGVSISPLPLPPATPSAVSVLPAPEAGVAELSLSSVVGEDVPDAAAESSVSLDVEPELDPDPDPTSSGQILVELLGS